VQKLSAKSPKISNDLKLYYYNGLSEAQLRLNNFDSAKICALQAIRLTSFTKDSALISNAWLMMSFAHNKLGRLDSALYFTRMVLDYSQRHADYRQYRSALNSMGTIMMQNKHPSDALKNYMEALHIAEQLKDSSLYAASYYNIGLAQKNLKNYPDCILNLQKAASLAQKSSFEDLLIVIYGTISDYYLETGNKVLHKEYLLRANDLAIKLNNYQFVAMGYANLAEGSLRDNDYSGAVKYGKLAISYLDKQPWLILKLKIDSLLYVSCKQLNQPAEALTWFESYEKTKYRIFNDDEARTLNKIMVELNVKEKNLTIARQQVELVSRQKSTMLNFILFIIVLILLLGVLTYNLLTRRFRNKLYTREKFHDHQLQETRE